MQIEWLLFAWITSLDINPYMAMLFAVLWRKVPFNIMNLLLVFKIFYFYIISLTFDRCPFLHFRPFGIIIRAPHIEPFPIKLYFKFRFFLRQIRQHIRLHNLIKISTSNCRKCIIFIRIYGPFNVVLTVAAWSIRPCPFKFMMIDINEFGACVLNERWSTR